MELPKTEAELRKLIKAERLAERRELAQAIVKLMEQHKNAGVQAGIWTAATYLDPRKTAFKGK